MSFLADYEPVEDRLRAFWSEHPNGRITTDLVHTGPDGYIVKASVWRAVTGPVEYPVNADLPDATGYAQEAVTERGVNSTSALENCETSAIGRALANLGYAAKGKRPSREEMSKTSAPPAAGHGSGPESGADTTSLGRSSTEGPSGTEKVPEELAPAGEPDAEPGEAKSDSPSGSSPGYRRNPETGRLEKVSA